MQAVFETVFDVAYLFTVLFLGIKMVKESRGVTQFVLYGVMALVLGLGDSFHLIPRAVALSTKGLDAYTGALGIGKCITSVTMTLFYMLLYYVWRERYGIRGKEKLTGVVWLLSAARIILVLMPQNQWLSKTPPLSWGIYRNIPFVLLGFLMITLFYRSGKEHDDADFRHLWLTIALSFGFYLPVVLLAGAVPPVGALMIPKTGAYVWTVWIGYHSMKQEMG
jgi:hypothetical protein